jgi:hypothetical protein
MNTPENNGKDVRRIKTHTVHGMGGSIKVMKSPKINKPIPVEPKRNNRWVVKFEGAYDIPTWAVKKTHRPKLVDGNWGNINIELRDVIGPSIAQAVVEGFRHSWQKKRVKIPTVTYSLEMLDPTGVTIEKWEITGKIIEADFGKLSYKKDKLSSIKLIIEPSKVILVY